MAWLLCVELIASVSQVIMPALWVLDMWDMGYNPCSNDTSNETADSGEAVRGTAPQGSGVELASTTVQGAAFQIRNVLVNTHRPDLAAACPFRPGQLLTLFPVFPPLASS